MTWISGEGKTMDNNSHTFKEVNIINLFQKLFILKKNSQDEASTKIDLKILKTEIKCQHG